MITTHRHIDARDDVEIFKKAVAIYETAD